ncbi:RNA polymerase sigma factor [Embleya sp. NPDC008237]|uniref:RNA polymerase sigma factor n=1 Tax=Embleya sp. NPDC008237 TaxID=3363978 RepID=UPI0036DFF4CB
MTTGLIVTLEPPDHGTTGTPICVDVVDLGHRTVAHALLVVGHPCRIELEPGAYAVHALLPSGCRIGGEFARVAPGAAGWREYVLSLADLAPHPWLARTALLVPQHTMRFGSLEDPRYAAVWLRLWIRGTHGWRPAPFAEPAIDEAPEGIRLVLDGPVPGPALIQVGSPHTPWELLRLPPGPQPSVTVRPSWPDPPRLVSAVLGTDPAAHALLGYLATGASRQAETIAEYIGEPRTGTQAIALGYQLLRTRRTPHSWPPAVLERFAGTPDGAIIAARHLLERMRTGAQARSAEAVRAAFTAAAAMGPPMCTEGLRILVEGLRSAGVEGGVATRYLAAADTTAPLLAFHGSGPDTPGSPTPDVMPDDAVTVASLQLERARARARPAAGTGPVERAPWAPETAWMDDFVRRTYPTAAAKAVMMCVDRRQAEDLLCRAYLTAAREMDPTTEARPDAWLHRRLGRNGWQIPKRSLFRTRTDLRFVPPHDATASQTSEALRALAAMAVLSRRQRVTIELNCLQRLPVPTIAGEVGTGTRTVAAQLDKARRALRQPLLAGTDGGNRRLGENLVARPADGDADVLYDLLRAWLYRTQAWLRRSFENDDEGCRRLANRVAAELRFPDAEAPR